MTTTFYCEFCLADLFDSIFTTSIFVVDIFKEFSEKVHYSQSFNSSFTHAAYYTIVGTTELNMYGQLAPDMIIRQTWRWHGLGQGL